eukprot:4345324-Pleurochrysis_carterae.AAC.1
MYPSSPSARHLRISSAEDAQLSALPHAQVARAEPAAEWRARARARARAASARTRAAACACISALACARARTCVRLRGVLPASCRCTAAATRCRGRLRATTGASPPFALHHRRSLHPMPVRPTPFQSPLRPPS